MNENKTAPLWIWYPGDYEIYHYMICHTKRQAKDARVPAFWRVSRPELAAAFELKVSLKEPKTITVYSHGVGRILLDGVNHGALNEERVIPAGEHVITVNVMNRDTFPSIFVEDAPFETGSRWRVHCYDKHWQTPESEYHFTKKDDDPSVFPFLYRDLTPVKTEEQDGGVLYDFGTEQFGPVTLERTLSMGDICVSYGESREEALEWDETILREKVSAAEGPYTLEARAFRCLFVKAESGMPVVKAKLEYLDLEDAAGFSCDNELINRVWDICKRTMHINSRQFYLDGPKQDGWVWGGDAYQTYLAGRYLFHDQDIARRTLRASFGRLPVVQHINTINDYSCYQLIALWEFYFATGDLDFVKKVWPNARALYEFILGRLEEKTGYMVAREGDWIFIDWSVIDKTDPNSTEQILLWQVHRVMSWLSDALGEPMPEALSRADSLKEHILRDFWKEELGAFICTPATGQNMVTRHANIMAILYDFVTDEQKEQICQRVLFNPAVVPITTPFFKFFELMAVCKVGHVEEAEDFMESYWGDMVKLGATTVWEQFDSTKKGIEHYSMYGQKFGASLCHAWGSGPIAILGLYVAGIRPTSCGSKTFDVEPKPGRYRSFDAAFPIAGGLVRVVYKNGQYQVTSTVPGGTFRLNREQYDIRPGETLRVKSLS